MRNPPAKKIGILKKLEWSLRRNAGYSKKGFFRMRGLTGEAWLCFDDIRWYDYQGTYPLDTASSI